MSVIRKYDWVYREETSQKVRKNVKTQRPNLLKGSRTSKNKPYRKSQSHYRDLKTTKSRKHTDFYRNKTK